MFFKLAMIYEKRGISQSNVLAQVLTLSSGVLKILGVSKGRKIHCSTHVKIAVKTSRTKELSLFEDKA